MSLNLLPKLFCLALTAAALTATKAPAKRIQYAGPAHTSLQDSVSLRNLHQNVYTVPEFFLFDIDWGFINAGQATLELMPGDKPHQWKIQTHAWCNAFFQTFYPVYDTILSIIDSAGIYPLRFEKNQHEGRYEAHIKSWFDQEKHRAWLQDTVCDIAPFTHDILSAFYYIRAQELKPGKSFEMDAVSGKKKYKLKVLCHRRQTISVPAGRFNTIVVEPKVVGVGLFKAKGKLTIWLTDDAHHIPVKMSSKIPVGSVSANLVKATGKVTLIPK